jgi:hypothetical protein
MAAESPERVEQMQWMLERHLNEVAAQGVEIIK